MSAAIPPHSTVRELFDCVPNAMQYFLDLGIHCVGCPTESFHTLVDVAREHQLSLDVLIHGIQNLAMQNECSGWL